MRQQAIVQVHCSHTTRVLHLRRPPCRSTEHNQECKRPDQAWCLGCEFESLAQGMAAATQEDVIDPGRITRNTRRIGKGLSPGRQEDAQVCQWA